MSELLEQMWAVEDQRAADNAATMKKEKKEKQYAQLNLRKLPPSLHTRIKSAAAQMGIGIEKLTLTILENGIAAVEEGIAKRKRVTAEVKRILGAE